MNGQLNMGGTRRLNRHYQSANGKTLWEYSRNLILRGYVPPYQNEHVTEVTGNSGLNHKAMPTKPINKIKYLLTADLHGENGEMFTGLQASTATPHFSPFIKVQVNNKDYANIIGENLGVYDGLQDFRQGGVFTLYPYFWNGNGETLTVNIVSLLTQDKWTFEMTSSKNAVLNSVLIYMNIYTHTSYNYFSNLRYNVNITEQLEKR